MYDIEKEKKEAYDAGNRALISLRRAKADLDSARTWGIFDIFGGGFLSTAIKHGKMSDASSEIEQAKWDLHNFSRELNDVTDLTGIDFGVGDFASFADFFFDGVLADFYVQSKINEARYQVNEAIWKVERVLDNLR